MSQSIVDKVAEAIWRSTVKRQVEWKDITNEARELWIKDAKVAIEAMRYLVKCDPKGCQADDEILQNYIDAALK